MGGKGREQAAAVHYLDPAAPGFPGAVYVQGFGEELPETRIGGGQLGNAGGDHDAVRRDIRL